MTSRAAIKEYIKDGSGYEATLRDMASVIAALLFPNPSGVRPPTWVFQQQGPFGLGNRRVNESR